MSEQLLAEVIAERNLYLLQKRTLIAALRLIATAYAGSSKSSEYMQGIARAALAKTENVHA